MENEILQKVRKFLLNIARIQNILQKKYSLYLAFLKVF